MTTTASSPVSVLGLGMMGSALAAALIEAGHPTTVWNRTAARTGPLVAQGAAPAGSVADAVAASPLVIVCLTTYDDVATVLNDADLSGRTLVNLTNGTPDQAREFAARATAGGAAYLDGGIMAVPQMIATDAAYVFYSGDDAAYARHRPTLAALGGTRWTGTDPGLAALWDLSLLTGMYGMVMGMAQAFALSGSAGVPARELAPLLADWTVAMTSGLVPATAEAVDTGHHLTDVSSLAVNRAAFPGLLAAYEGAGVDPSLFAPLGTLLDRAVAEGHGADGLSRLVELLKQT
ncbi:NAD(P)-dependent oxidoreductase [Streptomyces sp. SID14478]|uniref:NAD(P)-dependent oxidoreductase n=1 Tax=Streptomyces sp. SID14478 TaxID=2706073 RepID=UPI0013DF1802|nr:NAD(P)-binding domain-containing protein [Streptomyces sp. SID14478]NEB82415.1 NAD(P)-dependent oxidoreductase [Streptomyces sp. SID14478]